MEESEYFAKMLSGEETSEDPIDNKMFRRFRDMAIFVMFHDYVNSNKKDPKAYKKMLIDTWEFKVKEGFKEEIDEFNKMSESGIGQVFGSMFGSAEELEKEWNKKFNRTKEVIETIMRVENETE